MKTIKIKSGIFVIYCLAAILISCYSQALSAKDHPTYPRYLEVLGKVECGRTNLTGAMITVFCDSTKVDEHETGENGKFDFKLDMDKVYYVRFSKEGMITKVVKITTIVPQTSSLAYQYEYTFNINLVPGFQSADETEAFKKPVAKIIYNEKYDGFDFDQEYNREVHLEIISMKLPTREPTTQAVIARQSADRSAY